MKVSQKVVRQFQSQLLACGFWPRAGCRFARFRFPANSFLMLRYDSQTRMQSEYISCVWRSVAHWTVLPVRLLISSTPGVPATRETWGRSGADLPSVPWADKPGIRYVLRRLCRAMQTPGHYLSGLCR